MKTQKLISLLLLLFIVGNLSAQNIFIHAEQELIFGDFYLSDQGEGTIHISDNGEITSSGSVRLVTHSHSPAIFNISTDSKVPVKVEVEPFVQNLKNEQGAEMVLQANHSEPRIYVLEPGKSLRLLKGGTLHIRSEKASNPGEFFGELTLRVNLYRE